MVSIRDCVHSGLRFSRSSTGSKGDYIKETGNFKCGVIQKLNANFANQVCFEKINDFKRKNENNKIH